MSDRGDNRADFLRAHLLGEEDETHYRAWRTSHQVGEVMHIELVQVGEPWRFVNYVQPFEMVVEADQHQLRAEMGRKLLTVEGKGLRSLAQQITRRRVTSIHVYDPTTHEPLEDDEQLVTAVSWG